MNDQTTPPPPPPNDDPNTPPPVVEEPIVNAEAPAGVETNKDAKTMGMLCHLAALSGYVVPLGWIIGPLVVWLIKKDEHAFVNDQGKESLNFQITMLIAVLVAAATMCVGVGIVLLPIVVILNLVFVIIASVKANEGVYYRYPFNIRMIK